MAGLTIIKLRSSLTSDNASALIFLHDTWNIAETYQNKRAERTAKGVAKHDEKRLFETLY